ncbi:MAG TPA: S-methyl-5'-thioadenosine phosphorylase [Candidatus Bathyarchaeia archaeon]|jgi:5'-methylthioadenosine phosphorylase|nr:S-methyl-5'-thioadenosine phosphorylase [Candidatus Bathyarchaeia archaeon]
MTKADIGIIGGSGFYDLLEKPKCYSLKTSYGCPSDNVEVGKLCGRKVAFLPRHGKHHSVNPSEVNYRANILALKRLGVTRILALSTVGSLKSNIKPSDIVLVNQFVDRTTQRKQSFYSQGSPFSQVCHISMAEPMCEELRNVIIKVSRKVENVHEKGTYVCIEGPRFSTRAESNLFRAWGMDVVGMTLVPECVLAREAEICYAAICTVTDYDCWKDKPVNAEDVRTVMKRSREKVKKLLLEAIPMMPEKRTCQCKDALKGALI